VHAEARRHRVGDLARLQRIQRLLELGHELAWIGPAQVAAARGTARPGSSRASCSKLAARDSMRRLYSASRRARSRLGQLRAGAQQDVPRMALRDGRPRHAALAALDHLDDVEARAGPHDGTDAAFGQPLHRVQEQLRVALGRAQPELAAVGFGAHRLRHLAGHDGEVLAGPCAPQRVVGLGAQRLHLRLGCVLRHGDQHLRQVEVNLRGVGRTGLLFAQELLDLLVAHANPLVDFAVAQPGQQQLVAQVLPEARPRNAVQRQAPVQFGQVDLVLAREAQFGLVDRDVVGADAVLARQLQLGAFADQALQHDAAQFVPRRHRRALLRQLLLEPQQPCVDLVVGDRFGVHHGHDVVSRAWAGLLRRWPAAARLGRDAQLRAGGHRKSGGSGEQEGKGAWCHGLQGCLSRSC
jgi:hypothetical protein